jgi:hypothetical protein
VKWKGSRTKARRPLVSHRQGAVIKPEGQQPDGLWANPTLPPVSICKMGY